MTELTPQTIVNALIAKGNDLISLARQAYIFRASVAYLAQHIHSFLLALKPKAQEMQTDNQIQVLRQVQDLFESKWTQPPLNWTYVHEYISGFRKSLINIAPTLDLNPAEVIKYDEQQDKVNRIADLTSLRDSVQNLISSIT